jgi:hypothetical protein
MTRHHHDQWPARHQPLQGQCRQYIAGSEWAFEGLGLQVGVLIMSSNWNVEEMTAKY